MILTPKTLAERWGCKPDTVIAMIKDGRLQAFTLSQATCQRPQWKITEAAVQAFENATREPQPSKAKRRRQPDPGVIQFYK